MHRRRAQRWVAKPRRHEMSCLDGNRELDLVGKRDRRFWWRPSGADRTVALGSQRLSSSKGQNRCEAVTQRDGSDRVQSVRGLLCRRGGLWRSARPSSTYGDRKSHEVASIRGRNCVRYGEVHPARILRILEKGIHGHDSCLEPLSLYGGLFHIGRIGWHFRQMRLPSTGLRADNVFRLRSIIRETIHAFRSPHRMADHPYAPSSPN